MLSGWYSTEIPAWVTHEIPCGIMGPSVTYPGCLYFGPFLFNPEIWEGGISVPGMLMMKGEITG